MPVIIPVDVFSDVEEGTVTVANGSQINIVEISSAAYNALTTKSATTLYLITS